MADISKTLEERGARYGDFTSHAIISQRLQDVMRAAENWQRLSPDKCQALTVIADKIARILNGDPEYLDNWHDIAGYAKLAEDRCKTAIHPKPPEVRVFKDDDARPMAAAGGGGGGTAKTDGDGYSGRRDWTI